MKNIVVKYVSFLLSLTALAVISSAVSAKAETTGTQSVMYGTYTHNSKSAVGSSPSDQALNPGSQINQPVDEYRQIPTQQVIDRLGDNTETPTQEATAQLTGVQRPQPKGAGESQTANSADRNIDLQPGFGQMPNAQTPVSAASQGQTVNSADRNIDLQPGFGQMPNAQRPVSAASQSQTVNSADRNIDLQPGFGQMPKAQTPVSAADDVATQPAPRNTTITPVAPTPVPENHPFAATQPVAQTTNTTPLAPATSPANNEFVNTQGAAASTVAMPETQAPKPASDRPVNTQPAAASTVAMPEAQTQKPANDRPVNTQPADASTVAMPEAQTQKPANEQLVNTQPAAAAIVAMPKAQTQKPANEQLVNTQGAAAAIVAIPKAQTPVSAESATTQPAPGTTIRSAASLNQKPSTSPLPQQQPENQPAKIAQTDITPGRPTRSGYSYFAVGGNIGIAGSDTSLSTSNFALLSKIGLTRNFSIRPAVVIGDNTNFLLPITLDFPIGQTDPFGTFTFAPFVGAGASVSTNGSAGFLLTGGIDVPLSRQFTATASLNASIKSNPELGLLLGVGYNFTGF